MHKFNGLRAQSQQGEERCLPNLVHIPATLERILGSDSEYDKGQKGPQVAKEVEE